MSYQKQNWNPYDDSKTVSENIQNHAIATAEFLNHIEQGLEDVSRVVEEITPPQEPEKGEPGEPGKDGLDGKDGADGKSAYQLALEAGYTGTQEEWLASLKGEKGDPGQDGQDGIAGEKGDPGDNGKSAYELAVEGGYTGTQEEWLESLKGEPGDSGGEKGDPGADGKSAYEIAVENGFEGDEATWLASLKGEPGQDGQDGTDGKSAYEIAVEGGYTGTQEEWLASLKGEKGDQGEPGRDGKSVELALESPVNDEISKTDVSETVKLGDYFIAPNGEIYKVVGTKENDSNTLIVENTGKTLNVGGQGNMGDFKGEAIGHCSGLEVSVVNDGQKNPQLSVKYTDPTDEGVPYGGTVVCVKEDSQPADPADGIVIEDTMEKDKYKTTPLSLEIPRTEILQRNFNVTLFPYSSNKVYNLLKRESKDIQINWAESEDPYDEINIHNIFGHIFSACGNVYAITKNIDEDVFILNTINTLDMSILESKTITDPTSTIKPSTTHSLYGIGYYNTQLNLVFDNGILVTDTSSSNFNYYNIPSGYIKGDFIGNANHYSPARYQLSEGSTAGSAVIKLLSLTDSKYLTSTKLNDRLNAVKDNEGNISKFISVYISDKSNSDVTSKSVALLSNGLVLPFKITKNSGGTAFGMFTDYGIILSDIANIINLDKTCAHFIDENTLIVAYIESDNLIKIEKYILQTEGNSGYYFKYVSYSKEELYWDVNLINVDNLNIYITIDNNRYIVSIKDKTDGNVIFQAIEKNKQ